MKRNTRVGLVTSGGDCQGLNAAIRGVGKALFQYVDNVEIFGMYDGYKGLIEGDYKYMEKKDFSGILTEGGTILGTSRQRYIPGKAIVDEKGNDLMPAMLDTYNRLNLDCLVVMGGNGTQKSAKLLADAGMNIVTLPKTIDNDIYGTDTTFGFQSAVDIGTNVIDYIHSTASSHSRVFLVELMGRDAGWLTLNAGIASGADIILIPEIPYNIEKIAEALEERRRSGRNFSIIAVAEGAVSDTDAVLSEEERRLGRCFFYSQGGEPPLDDILPHRQRAGGDDRPGDPRHRAGPLSARRPPVPVRPRARHPVRHRGGEADHGEKVLHHGRHTRRAHSVCPA